MRSIRNSSDRPSGEALIRPRVAGPCVLSDSGSRLSRLFAAHNETVMRRVFDVRVQHAMKLLAAPAVHGNTRLRFWL